MKILTTAAAVSAALALICADASAKNAVTWNTIRNAQDHNGRTYHIERFTVTGDFDFDKIAFNRFARGMATLNPADTLTEIIPGYYCISSPRLAKASEGDTVNIDLRVDGALRNVCYAPDGVHSVDSHGNTDALCYTIGDIMARPEQWQLPYGDDIMPYGEDVYEHNAALCTGKTPGIYDVVPSYKLVRLTGGETSLHGSPTFIDAEQNHKEWFRATITNGNLTIECAPGYRQRALERLTASGMMSAQSVPEAVIEDWPDFEYRGLMIDIARNFQHPDELVRVLKLMNRYGLNKLHFHFADDEAWRLDIPGLPELTDVGSRRGYTLTEDSHLAQIFAGNGDPDSQWGTANGFFTREEFINMLKTATQLGIEVIPEIESPGHARAAIKAMENRFRLTGDDTYRLIDPDDTSRFTSAQAFHDNVMNPALPGPINFMVKVAEEIQKMYAEAGATLPAIHIGGDEVAKGAWTGSPAAQSYMAQHGITDERRLHLIFVTELVERLSKMGIKISGWQEIAVGHSDEYNSQVRPNVYSVNCWSTLGKLSSVTAQSAEAGYPTVLSNVDHFYMDLCYSPHPYERGLSWGGYVNELASLHGYARDLCPTDAESFKNVIGVSGQLFSETIRSPQMLESYLLPKMLGLAERAWNSTPTYSDAAFESFIYTKEITYWISHGITFHVAQPGIKVENDTLMLNYPAPLDGSPIQLHYTTDGSEPTQLSPLYTGPTKLDNGHGPIKAKAFYRHIPSVTSIQRSTK
jgi:N-acetyl-beta-hexosaminidase